MAASARCHVAARNSVSHYHRTRRAVMHGAAETCHANFSAHEPAAAATRRRPSGVAAVVGGVKAVAHKQASHTTGTIACSWLCCPGLSGKCGPTLAPQRASNPHSTHAAARPSARGGLPAGIGVKTDRGPRSDRLCWCWGGGGKRRDIAKHVELRYRAGACMQSAPLPHSIGGEGGTFIAPRSRGPAWLSTGMLLPRDRSLLHS